MVRLSQPWNAASPISATSFKIVTLVRPVQPTKVLLLISVTPFGIVALVKSEIFDICEKSHFGVAKS